MPARRRPGATLAPTTNIRDHWQRFYAFFDAVLDTSLHSALAGHVAHRSTIHELKVLLTESRFEVTKTEEDFVAMRYADRTATVATSGTKKPWLRASQYSSNGIRLKFPLTPAQERLARMRALISEI